ncbi:hypothetical protein [Burkholderia ubonensis]|uniref:T6SS immunity protein Tli3 family protein n=1 Tax=Burkholderia ubonensis TaxID=101571 RepID=UPI000AF2955A|nr:hypothetical protein [Burkholderia ubonensis]
MIRYFSLAVSALSLVLLTACSLLIPPGIPSGMTNPAARGTPISSYPERLVYRIDDHRYITIQGNRNCVGMIWYYDTHLGVRTAVAATGLTLGSGAFGGYYAINSEYVVIPAIEFSQMSGSLMYIYYSHDGGRTFKSFLWGRTFLENTAASRMLSFWMGNHYTLLGKIAGRRTMFIPRGSMTLVRMLQWTSLSMRCHLMVGSSNIVVFRSRSNLHRV